jgi:hypothetical protein
VKRTIEKLLDLSTAPNDSEAFEGWLGQGDALPFLRDNASANEVVVYAGLPHTFIHGVLVPESSVSPPDISDLMSWNGNTYSSWGVVSSGAEAWIESPLSGSGSKTLKSGEQLVFGRSFDGVPERQHYIEILQKFVHVFGIHHMPERSAWCRLDRRGDLEDVVRVSKIKSRGNYWGGTVVTFDHRLLHEYAVLTRSALVWMFDFTRFRLGDFGSWDLRREDGLADGTGIYYRQGLQPGSASYMRGVQIRWVALSREALLEDLWGSDRRPEKQYATLVAHDWRHNCIAEISCAPSALANYFSESDLPFETTPAFFHPEVLLKYKADREKYRLTDRSVSCRGAWHLETYDVNEAGQVHTYLVYLGHLPYEEQLHWKQYNEPPKAPISKRALATDFEGKRHLGYDALPSLQNKLREMQRGTTPWWTLRAEDLMDRVQYPVTASTEEWKEEILALDQLLVEGFEAGWLRTKAKTLGRAPDPKLGSLKLIEECLIGLGFEEGHARSATSPLHEVHNLRSKLKGHASGQTGQSIKSSAIAAHGSLGEHFKQLCQACDKALETIVEAFSDPRMA